MSSPKAPKGVPYGSEVLQKGERYASLTFHKFTHNPPCQVFYSYDAPYQFHKVLVDGRIVVKAKAHKPAGGVFLVFLLLNLLCNCRNTQ
ncbi:hypothetical protein C8F04DRAFT_1270101 [Mycena alexandri]|uniref:Uncharacterized protein n=1 Tax=Mycena alexandri TaxID=1745969 RepID=A0AAD6WTB0_9AGAR|nr:hypothetical protein C8F04DRAFT_1270101 [Mycena alexandri]